MNGPTRILLVYVALSTCILSAAEPPVLDGEPDASFSVHWLNEASTYVVLCARSGDDSWAKVADRLAEVRKARAVVTFDENQPQDLLPLMRKLAPENVAYVGDETRDIQAAKKVGLRSVAVTWGLNTHDALAASSPDHIVLTPDDLADTLA